MALVSRQITIPTNVATPLFTQRCTSPNSWQVFIYNFDATVKLGLGDSTVSRTTAGHQIGTVAEQSMIIPFGESIYGITMSGAGTAVVGIMAMGQPS
jgi:hypothetical protein